MTQPGLNPQISRTSTGPNNSTAAVAAANMRGPPRGHLTVDDTPSTVTAASHPPTAVVHPSFLPVGQVNLY